MVSSRTVSSRVVVLAVVGSDSNGTIALGIASWTKPLCGAQGGNTIAGWTVGPGPGTYVYECVIHDISLFMIYHIADCT